MRGNFSKKKPLPFAGNGFYCELCAKRKPSSSPPMEGNDYPDNNYNDVCDTKRVHVVINPHYGIFLTASHGIVKNILSSFLDSSVWLRSLDGN
jgi:hypothetical protein